MEKLESVEQRKILRTYVGNSSLVSILEQLSLEGFTLIFPWGEHSPSSRRTVNYLRYVISLPQSKRATAILRLLGLVKYRSQRLRRLSTLNLRQLRRFTRVLRGESMRHLGQTPIGIESTKNL